MPPGGWVMFTRYVGRELFLFHTYDLQMFLPDHPPLLSFRSRWPGHRRVFDTVSASLGVPVGGGPHPWPELYDADGRVGGVPVRFDGHCAGLAVGAEAAVGASMVGVVHCYALEQRPDVVMRLSRLAPGSTCFDAGARLVETDVRIGPEGYPARALAWVSEGPQRLPASLDVDTRARIIANATPWQREAFARGRYYVEALGAAMEELGAVDPEIAAMLKALDALERAPMAQGG